LPESKVITLAGPLPLDFCLASTGSLPNLNLSASYYVCFSKYFQSWTVINCAGAQAASFTYTNLSSLEILKK
jgi:hypothetical protein